MLIERFDEIDKLDAAIDEAFTSLAGHDPTSDGYAKIVDQITKLTKIKEIIGNLKLKAADSINKETVDQSTLEFKDRELEFKTREHEEALEHKTKELAFKTRELDVTKNRHDRDEELKKWELENGFALKERELDLRDEEANKPNRVSADTWAMVGANLAGILLIVGYERVNVIASKAIGFVLKR